MIPKKMTFWSQKLHLIVEIKCLKPELFLLNIVKSCDIRDKYFLVRSYALVKNCFHHFPSKKRCNNNTLRANSSRYSLMDGVRTARIFDIFVEKGHHSSRTKTD